MVAYTTTYNLKKPTVADDEDVWGGYLNDSMDLIDDVLNGTTPVTGIDINSGTVDNVVIGGTTAVAGTFTVLTADTSLGVTGNITVSGTVDGRDVAADGTKLDGIEVGATADQTKADIDALGIAASTASTLATARNIAVTGAVTGNANFDGSGNISITTTATSDPTVTLTGAVTGSGTMTNLGNVSIATTATADPTLTLSGDASGSATFTNLGNATLSVTVADDSHNHVISNVDGLQTALDGKLSTSGTAADSNLLDGIDSGSFVRSDANDTVSGQLNLTYGDQSLWSTHNGNSSAWRGRMGHRNSTADTSIYLGSYGSNGGVFSHNYALTLWDDLYVNTVDGSTGGNVRLPSTTYIANNTVWHAGNDGSGSGLDADLLDGVQGSSYLRSDASDTFTGTLTLTGSMNASGTVFAESLQEDYDALSGTSPAPDADNAGAFSLTMSGNTTFTFGGVTSGRSVGFILQLTGNGGTVTWPASVDWAGGTAPDAPASGETDILVFWTRDGGTTWYGVQSIDAAA
jgi:hypothetical protein